MTEVSLRIYYLFDDEITLFHLKAGASVLCCYSLYMFDNRVFQLGMFQPLNKSLTGKPKYFKYYSIYNPQYFFVILF